MGTFLESSVARKVAMGLSAIFLIFFLVIHLSVNLTSVFSPELFNTLSHFMGTNPVVQFAMQPVLLFGVIFHFVMGYVLEIKNRKARGAQAYEQYNGAANASWMSRNMIISGAVILIFLLAHLNHFWVHEMTYKYIEFRPEDPTRYYHELRAVFRNPITVVLYVLGFVFLCLHLLHGFKSSMQSVGLMSIRKKGLIVAGNWYSYIICGGFAFIALYHYFSQL